MPIPIFVLNALSIALSSALSCALVLFPVFFLVLHLVLCLVFSLMLASALISTLSGAFSSVPSSVLSHARALSINLAIKLNSALSCAHFGLALPFPFNGHIRSQESRIYPENQRWVAMVTFQCLHQAPLILNQAQFCRSSN